MFQVFTTYIRPTSPKNKGIWVDRLDMFDLRITINDTTYIGVPYHFCHAHSGEEVRNSLKVRHLTTIYTRFEWYERGIYKHRPYLSHQDRVYDQQSAASKMLDTGE